MSEINWAHAEEPRELTPEQQAKLAAVAKQAKLSYLMLFEGKLCLRCVGSGEVRFLMWIRKCPMCQGYGTVPEVPDE